MKPSKPKKEFKNSKPNCKSGEVRYGGLQDLCSKYKPFNLSFDAEALEKQIIIWYKKRD